jgi:hypothetical protein
MRTEHERVCVWGRCSVQRKSVDGANQGARASGREGALFAWNFQAGRGVRCLRSVRLATQSVGGCEVGLADRIASRRISPCFAPALALAVLNLLD